MAAAPTTDKAEKPTNGKAIWTNWPGVFKAAQVLNLKVPQVRALVDSGDLPVFAAPDGSQRFDPQMLQDIRPEFARLTEEDFGAELDATIVARKVEQQTLDAAAERQGIPVESVRMQAEFVRTVIAHNTQLHNLIINMAEDARKNLNASNVVHEAVIKRQQEQLEHYHRLADGMILAREQQSQLQAERELAMLQEKDRIDRRQQVLGIAKDQAGKLVSIIAAKLGVSESLVANLTSKFDVSKLQAAVAFFESIQPDQVDIAMSSGFFSPEQVQYLSTITGRSAPNADQPKAESESPSCETPPAEIPSPVAPTPS